MINKFLNYMQYERNRSELTVKSYGEDLREFEAFFKSLEGGSYDWGTVDADIVRNWMEQMMDQGNRASSVCRRLSALRSFYRFALARGLVEKDPVHSIVGPKKEKPLPQFVKESEMNELLDPVMWNLDDMKDLRARTIILLFYMTGMRLAELVGLDDKDVDFVNSQLKVTGKRDKQRIVPFGEEVAVALHDYIGRRDEQLAEAGMQPSGALFETETGERISREQVRRLVQENLARVCTLKKRSPHVLRHTFATAMMNHDAGLESLQKLLGHARLSTTEIYTHTTFEQLKKVYMNAHPRA